MLDSCFSRFSLSPSFSPLLSILYHFSLMYVQYEHLGFLNIREKNIHNDSGVWERFLRGVIESPCRNPSG